VATKLTIRNVRTGATGAKALKDMSSMLDNLPDRIKDRLPSTFAPNVTNRIRGYFKDNYIQQYLWKRPSTSAAYAEFKNRILSDGDSFNIGALGTAPVIHSASVFGRRTDTIFKAIGSRTATNVKVNFENQGRSGFKMNVAVGIDDSQFEGVSYRIKGGKSKNPGKVVSRSTDNSLTWFSRRITRAGRKSVLTTISDSQARNLASFIGENFKAAIRSVIWSRS